MLLRFSVTNHRSIRVTQELSMVASALDDPTAGLIPCATITSGSVLPSIIIYGPNASGKSNILSALSFMRNAVVYSHARGEPGGTIATAPFLLDEESNLKASVFEADFMADGVRYNYGFSCSASKFESEWLSAFPNQRRQILFERTKSSFEFGRGLKGHNKTISDLTRPNSLFLSAGAQNGHQQMSIVAEYFRKIRSYDATKISDSDLRNLARSDVDRRVIDLLSATGTGVVGFRREKIELTDAMREMRSRVTKLVQELIGDEAKMPVGENEDEHEIELAHRTDNERLVYFKANSESDGTKRLLVLLIRVFRILDEGGLLYCDEFDGSLHTQACEAVLALFSRSHLNPNGAQLIATTHDTNLLRSKFLRRDQVWFTEKDKFGSTHVYPLTDIKTRKGDNIERGYLQGRYGAMPFSGPIDDLLLQSE